MNIRVQSVINTNHGLQVTYVNEADIDEKSGIMEARTLDLPHEVIAQPVMDELVDAVKQLIEVARVARRRPEDSFVAPR